MSQRASLDWRSAARDSALSIRSAEIRPSGSKTVSRATRSASFLGKTIARRRSSAGSRLRRRNPRLSSFLTRADACSWGAPSGAQPR